MNRKSHVNNIGRSLPAIKLIRSTKGKSAIHIGWLRTNGEAFCLCGQENISSKLEEDYWESKRYFEAPDITCKKCQKIWKANLIRKGETTPPQTLVLSRMIREHLKSEGAASSGYNPLYSRDDSHLTPDEKIYDAIFKEAYNRRMKSDATLIAVEAEGYVHLARALHKPGKAETVCEPKLVGNLIGCTEEEYKLHKHITCPDCIAYIKDNDLDVEFHEMEQRHRMLEALKQRMEHYKREFEFAKKQYAELVVKTIIGLNA